VGDRPVVGINLIFWGVQALIEARLLKIAAERY
jgi:hypothetical protein